MKRKRKAQVNLFDELIIDSFAGGGGASTGIELALARIVDIAINHDPDAIAMHRANHPYTTHYCESIYDVDPKKAVGGRSVGLGWFSPDCTHFSKAKGDKPVKKSIRGLAWVMVKWCAQTRLRVGMLENVEEFTTWGPLIAKRDKATGRVKKVDGSIAEPGEVVPYNQQQLIPDPKRKGQYFRDFVKALKILGYQVEWKIIKACDFGAPTTRKRFFLIARCDGKPIVWPKPTHGRPSSEEVKNGILKPWRSAAEIIDWSIPCRSIFDRDKPLAENTLRRIALGLKKFVIDNPDPFVVELESNGQGMITPYVTCIGQTGTKARAQSLKAPLTTVVSKQEHILISPVVTRQFGNSVGHQITSPLGTVTAGGGGKSQLVAAFLATYHQETKSKEGRGASLKNPVPTIDTSNRYALVSSNLVKLRGKNIGTPITEPVPTITAGGNHIGEVRAFMVQYNGTGIGQSLNEPLHTITARDRFGLVTIQGQDYQIIDITMRMLEPHELFAAQGFPPDYIISVDDKGRKYPKNKQVDRCGNSVSPVIPKALAEANLPELIVKKNIRTMKELKETVAI